jgi:glycerate kinase
MPLRVLIAPDKFKGTLAARPVAEAIALGWKAVRPDDTIQLLPISDGGDGFGELLGELTGAMPQTTATVDAAHRPHPATWWWQSETRTATIESARIIGLALLPPQRYHPFELDTFGLGAVFRAAADLGATRCLVGLGGSATNDAGFGLARALGWRFFDSRGDEIERWPELRRLAMVRPSDRARLFDDLVVAVDVQNPLLGPRGCTRVYGPQKGLRLQDFELAEHCLGRLLDVLEQELQLDFAGTPGSGAAGGLGFGLCSFLRARLEPGFRLFAEQAHLEERLAAVDLVVTGEGGMDEQTLMGKGVGELAQRCQRIGVPCLAIAGMVQPGIETESLFAMTRALTPDFVTKDRAMTETAAWLERLGAELAAEWFRRATSRR